MNNHISETILIVEDDSILAALERRCLERAGYQVVIATTVEETLQELQRSPVSLILLDYRLPGIADGLELYAQLKAAGHDLPVILVTGFSTEATVIKALRAGVRDFITKSPEYIDYLPEAVERVLKQAMLENRLAQSEARLAGIISSAMDAILTVDVDRRITLFNAAAERIFRQPAAEAVGQPIEAFIPALASETHDLFRQSAHRSHLCGNWFELEGVRPDGATFPLEASLSATEVGGRKLGIVIVRDITEKKKLEAQFLRAQRLESIGTLAGGIAHDLNNVLTPIVMGLELLDALVPEQFRQSILVPLRASAQRGAEMVRQVLSFARGVEPGQAPLPLRHLIRDIEGLLRYALPKSIAVRTDVPRDIWPVTGDATQLHQAVMNLCINARDAMPQGGRLTISADNVEVDESQARSHPDARVGPHVRVQVADTGAGIAPEILDRIFDPFFTTKELGKGTGLGLSTTLAIVKSHGGWIDVESEIGKGTSFTFYLPAQANEMAGWEPPERAAFPEGKGETILVVDDEAGIREIARSTLAAHGYRVLTANHGGDALDYFMHHGSEIDAVITDLAMPIMDGATTIRALRELNIQVPIIAASGLVPTGEETDPADVQAFLRKPYTTEQLLSTLRTVLRKESDVLETAAS